MKKKLIIRAMLVVLIFTTACRKPATPKVDIAVVSQTSFTELPVTLAQDLGYFREENLDVTLEDVAGASRAIDALAGKSAQVGSIIFDNLVVAAGQGKEFQSFTLITMTPGLVLAVSPLKEGKIQTVADLKKRKVGITTFGSSTEMFVRYLCSRNSVPAEAIQFVAGGAPRARLAALEKGEVDAAVVSEPSISILKRKYGHVKLLADSRTAQAMKENLGFSDYPGTVLFSTPEWLAQNPETARKLARALVRAQNYILTHSPAEISAKLTSLPKPDDLGAFNDGLGASISSYSPDGLLRPESLQNLLAVLNASGVKLRNQLGDLSRMVTNDYLPN
jgi:sulfonate transport system substrate-binding protein